MHREQPQPKPSTLDKILARLDRPEVAEKREELAKIVGLDGDMMEATLLHLAADLLPMTRTAAKLRTRANYDLCKFACRQGAKLGAKHAESVQTAPPTPMPSTKTMPSDSTWTWKGK
jgi:hypothetical protein